LETSHEQSPETVRQRAAEACLTIDEEESARLARGVARNQRMAARLRELLHSTTEPAPVFAPLPPEVR
jgi:hypothetical protein